MRGENRPPCSRLRFDLPTKISKGVNNKSGARREKKSLRRRYERGQGSHCRGVREAFSRPNRGSESGFSRAACSARNPDYLYSELLYVTHAYCGRGSVKRASRASFSPERTDARETALVLNCISEIPTSSCNHATSIDKSWFRVRDVATVAIEIILIWLGCSSQNCQIFVTRSVHDSATICNLPLTKSNVIFYIKCLGNLIQI